ncbi:MAG: ABC transporter permease [Chloroflexi bacterium]|nr:ABC transporter permease [Chloroflexota bacterium]
MSTRAAAITEVGSLPAVGARSPRRRLLSQIQRRPLGALALGIVILVIAVAILADVISPQDPYRIFNGQTRAAPGVVAANGVPFVLGSDESGRDILSRIIHGARVSLWVGVLAVAVGTLGGTIVGVVSGYRGGRVDLILQRVMDSAQAIPSLVLALLLMAVLGSSLTNVILAIGIVQIPYTNRVVRSAVLSLKQETFVESARAIGGTDTWIMLRHIVPNVFAPIIIISTSGLGGAILTEAYLSFLGLGAPPPIPSWGGMVSTARTYMLTNPQLLLAPAVALSVTVLAWNLAGDALRDILDPRLRHR